MKAALPLFALCLFAAFPAGAVTCPAPPRGPVIEIDHPLGSPRYDHSLTQRQIARRQGASRHTRAQTQVNTRFEMAIEFQTRSRGRGGPLCAALTRVKVSLGFPEITVFMPRDYPQGSCEYAAVLEHENQHVAIARRTLGRMSPDLAQALRRGIRAIEPVRTSSAERAKRLLGKKVETLLRRQMDRLGKAHDKAQKSIDTRQEYARIQGRCSNW